MRGTIAKGLGLRVWGLGRITCEAPSAPGARKHESQIPAKLLPKLGSY